MSEEGGEVPQQKNIAIVGTAPSSWELAPYGDETWEIWGCAGLFQRVPRWDRWYELHTPDQIGRGWESVQAAEAYRQWLTEQTKPIYMQEEYDFIPASVRYPIEEVLQHFGRYFCSSISYMLAHAIMECAPVLHAGGTCSIGLWGVDMALSSEYGDQRPSCEYFIGLARGMGIDVHVPPECDLLKTRLIYAYEQDQGYTAKIRAKKRELSQRKRQIESEARQAQMAQAAHDGALDVLEWLDQTFGDYGAPDTITEN